MINKKPTIVWGIDAGNKESAIAVIRWDEYGGIKYSNSQSDKLPNNLILDQCRRECVNGTDTLFAIEMTAVYGCPTTKEVLETTRVIGRIQEITRGYLIPRMDVKMHLLGRTNLKDSHIIAHLVGRFAKSSKNHGKGTKKEPDYFYGIKADIWQAFAVGVTLIDKLNQNQNIRR